MKEKLRKIEEYYMTAWKHLVKNDVKSATLTLYNRMPFDLYDLSLDILYNRNLEFSNEELRHLIEKVDNKLCEESQTEESLEEDNFNGQY